MPYTKVRIFSNFNKDNFETEINNFICNPGISVINIQYSTCSVPRNNNNNINFNVPFYSALVYYH